jgi:hypothetical protein
MSVADVRFMKVSYSTNMVSLRRDSGRKKQVNAFTWSSKQKEKITFVMRSEMALLSRNRSNAWVRLREKKSLELVTRWLIGLGNDGGDLVEVC